jgi:arsenite methyltransferase
MNEDPNAIRESVREHYAAQAASASCCGSDACCDTSSSKLYPEQLLTELPQDVTSFSLGCGDPITLANLVPGQTVLDLGSGGGLDCFLAAKKVGPSGRAIGVDMTPEMIERARKTAERLKIRNVEFRQGFLEELPVDANSIDVVISNCVINLAPDKSKVLDEVFRVLKPGAKMAISDIVTEGPLPDDVKRSLSAWAGCIAGALDINEYRAALKEAGFADIEITPTYFGEAEIDEAIQDMGKLVDIKSFTRETIQKTVFSARITAIKP